MKPRLLDSTHVKFTAPTGDTYIAPWSIIMPLLVDLTYDAVRVVEARHTLDKTGKATVQTPKGVIVSLEIV